MRSTLRLSVTRFLRTPRWTVPILLTLVVAIGSTAAIFSVIDAVFLRSYPYGEPGRLVVLHDEHRGMGKSDLGLSGPEFFDYAAATKELSGVGAYTTGRVPVLLETPRQVESAWFSEDRLEVLRVQPFLGRGFTPDEARPGGPHVALVSHRFWRQHLSGRLDLEALPPLRTDGNVVEVVGVLPEGFRLPTDLGRSDQADLYLPLRLNAADPGHRQNPVLSVVGRLAPGSTMERARNEQERIVKGFLTAYGESYPEAMGYTMKMLMLSDEVVGDVRRSLLVVCGAVALLFLVALGNASGLILARLDERRQELGIRVAVGARFTQLFRLFMAESLVLAIAAAVPGVALAYLMGRFLLAFHSDAIPRLSGMALDQWLLLFVGTAALVIVLVFAVASTVRIARSHWAKQALSREAPAGGSGLRPGTARHLLAGGQIALTVALAVGAMLLISSYRRLMAVDLGFESDNVLAVDVSLPESRYDAPATVTSFYGSLLREVRANPGVESAALVTFLPLERPNEVWPIEIQGRAPEHGSEHAAHQDGGAATGVEAQVVSEGYFRTMGIPVRTGRDFLGSDEASQGPVVLVNEAFVREFLPTGGPLGRYLRPRFAPNVPWASIIGVVSDVRHNAVTEEPRPQVYFLYQQIPSIAGVAVRQMQLVTHTRADAEKAVAPVRRTIWALDPELALGEVRTLGSVVARATSRMRFPMQLLGIFTLMAVVVSLSGIYGVITQMVVGSTRELGIRMALGATPSRLALFVMSKGLVLTLSSVLVGLLLAMALVRVAGSLFLDAAGGGGAVYLGVGLAVTAAAAVACLVPARRAGKTDPMQAIREAV